MQINQQLQIAANNWWWDYLDHVISSSKSDVLIVIWNEETQVN